MEIIQLDDAIGEEQTSLDKLIFEEIILLEELSKVCKSIECILNDERNKR